MSSYPPLTWYTIADGLRRFNAFPKSSRSATLADTNDTDASACVGGSCACRSVSFEVDGPLDQAQYCHCSRCQRARSGAFASNGFTALENVRFTRGEAHLKSFKIPNAKYFTQTFCDTCGSLMPRLDLERGIAVIPFGGFDISPALTPSRHVHVASKVPWIQIADELPQFGSAKPN